MKNTLIEAEVVALLRKQQGARTQQVFAKSLGISKQYLNDIFSGRRSPGAAVLDYLKLERVFRFKRHEKAKKHSCSFPKEE